MKLVFDGRFINKSPSGIGTYSRTLLDGLSSSGERDIEIFVLVRDGSDTLFDLAGVEVISVDYSPRSLRNQLCLPKLLRKVNADLYHCPDGFAPITFSKTPCPYIITVHDMIPIVAKKMLKKSLKSRFLPIWRRWIARQCKTSRHIITVSEHSKRDIIRFTGIDAEKVSVIPNGIVSSAREASLIARSKMELLFVGRGDPYKNLAGLLRAIKLLRNRGVPATLTAVGSIDKRYTATKSLCDELKLTDAVRWAWRVDNDSLLELYQRSAVFVAPSFHEGFDLPSLEAMICSLPVAASDIPAHREMLADACAYFNPADPDNIADVLQSLLESQANRDLSADRGLIQAAKYPVSKMIESHRRVYLSHGRR